MRRVVVTGLGPLSPIATGKDAYWQALREGRNGIGPITTFELGDCPVTFGAEIKDFDPARWMDGKEAKRSDRAIQFAVAASKLAVEDAKLDTGSLDPYRLGVYIGTGQGGIETSFNSFKTMMEKGSRRVSPFFIPMMISNMSTAYVAIVHGAKGPNLCVVTACATSLHSLGEAYHTIVRDDADVILAGGTEAALRAISIAGFASMKALSTRMDSPETASRPFDKDRDGFVMGEGAGVLVLEELEHAKARGAHIYGEFVGYGTSCDAGHITAPDPEAAGALYATRHAMKMAGWSPEQVDYINAHGTSTDLNDKMESMMVHKVFGDRAKEVVVTSTKSLIGHCLGAAGALETIAAFQAIEQNYIHPTLNYTTPDPECDINLSTGKGVEKKVDRLLVNSFGFGGHNGVLAFQRYV
ncbi:MAG: beta-ketoacyl-ACP synthase II [Fretibacterium sp.]|uniref:beta-ketoacyl-ACP synthase II n=1 Tax=Fretibacterium sp. OH1220_COT-178 TaxID=2491047 RepID=UPI000F5F24EA|nr:beta-ketoacyl-ACP synthase II [Fretibacterium sp. OH1220_COT-178]MDO4785637.1 beta-ketoacyl-ACP synthase II [Fretibacterium sp.]RRD64688.1 beta-ketoacyl-[acyl-carrier-protein] synthase II [Fretibacterium sp. OH1220_COT-178]